MGSGWIQWVAKPSGNVKMIGGMGFKLAHPWGEYPCLDSSPPHGLKGLHSWAQGPKGQCIAHMLQAPKVGLYVGGTKNNTVLLQQMHF